MDEADKIRLRQNRPSITNNVHTENIVDALISQGILTEDDDERIKAEATTKDRAAALLNMLPKKGPNAFKVFCDALSTDPVYEWLVDKLQQTDITCGPSMQEPQFPDVTSEVFRIVTKDAGALKNWKFLARQLGLDEVDIAEIDHCYRGLKEQSWQMLVTWKDRQGSDASVISLAHGLRECGHNAVAERLVRTF